MSESNIRIATEADIEALSDFREAMFRDMGYADEDRLARLRPRYAAYLHEHLAEGDYIGWIAEGPGGEAVASVGLLWERVPPTVRNLSGRQAYILALYVRPAYRRQGLGRALAQTAVEHARSYGADVVSLHATEEGRSVYERMGFTDSPEMRLFTDPGAAHWSPSRHVAAEDAD